MKWINAYHEIQEAGTKDVLASEINLKIRDVFEVIDENCSLYICMILSFLNY